MKACLLFMNIGAIELPLTRKQWTLFIVPRRRLQVARFFLLTLKYNGFALSSFLLNNDVV